MNSLYIKSIFALISYGILMVVLSALPERFWDRFLHSWEVSQTSWKFKKQRLPLIGEIALGELLLIGLQEAEAKISLGQKIIPNELFRYKFYTDLLEQLFESHRRMGVPIKKILPDIRRGLSRDLQFERKILAEIINALLQFGIIALTTWGFVFLSSLLVEIRPSRMIMIYMFLLQCLGAVCFFLLMKWLKKRSFADFSSALTELYLFSSYMEVGLPLNDVLKRSLILEGRLIHSVQFLNFGSRTKNLIARMKETGFSPREETQEIIQGMWHHQDENFGKFTKKVQALKFTILALFYLPAYFLYLYSIFKFFMEQ